MAPTVGYMVQVIKGTSLAAIIGFTEVTRAGQIINNATFQPLIVFSVVAAIYFVAVLAAVAAGRADGAAPAPARWPAEPHAAIAVPSDHHQGDNPCIRATPPPPRLRRALGLAAAFGAAPVRRWRRRTEEIKKKGEITSACWSTSRPTARPNAQNQPDGYDADVARCWPRTRREGNLVPVTGPNRIPFLLTNKVDLLVASLGHHARARQAGAVLQALLRRRRSCCYGAEEGDHQGPGRPEGPAHRRGPRQHAGHRADRRSRRRAPRSAASTTTPRPCRR